MLILFVRLLRAIGLLPRRRTLSPSQQQEQYALDYERYKAEHPDYGFWYKEVDQSYLPVDDEQVYHIPYDYGRVDSVVQRRSRPDKLEGWRRDDGFVDYCYDRSEMERAARLNELNACQPAGLRNRWKWALLNG